MNNPVLQDAFWPTMAQAFLPPQSAEVARAFCRDLADDLAEMADDACLDLTDQIAALRESLRGFQDGAPLLLHYSSLFLTPPIRARLNLGFYLDGMVNGPALDAIEYLMDKYRIARQENFHALPDHLACLLETLTMLCGVAEAEADRVQLVQWFLLPGLSRLGQAIADASDIDSPYLHLARLTEAALLQSTPLDESVRDDRRERRRQARQDLEKGVWRSCASCAKPYAREKELQIMARALEAQNLPSEHLSLCPDCRSAERGWFTKSIG